MSRPLKTREEKRCRWDALYVTAAERAAVSEAAKALDLSVSRYLISLHQRARPVILPDSAAVLSGLYRAEQALLLVARQLPDDLMADVPCETLLSIERDFRLAVLPWYTERRG